MSTLGLKLMEVKMSHPQQSGDKHQPQPQLAEQVLSLRKPISVGNSNFNYHLLQSTTLIEREILSFTLHSISQFYFMISEHLSQELNAAFGRNFLQINMQNVIKFVISVFSNPDKIPVYKHVHKLKCKILVVCLVKL